MYAIFTIKRYEELGLGVKLSNELNLEQEVVDLQITMAVCAGISPRSQMIFDPFPPDFLDAKQQTDFASLKEVLAKLPTVQEMVDHANNEVDLRAYLEGFDKKAYRLVRWLMTSNRTHLIKLPADRVHFYLKFLLIPFFSK